MLRIFGCSVGVSVCAGYVGYVTPLHQCYSALMIGLSVFRQHKSVLRRLCGEIIRLPVKLTGIFCIVLDLWGERLSIKIYLSGGKFDGI